MLDHVSAKVRKGNHEDVPIEVKRVLLARMFVFGINRSLHSISHIDLDILELDPKSEFYHLLERGEESATVFCSRSNLSLVRLTESGIIEPVENAKPYFNASSEIERVYLPLERANELMVPGEALVKNYSKSALAARQPGNNKYTMFITKRDGVNPEELGRFIHRVARLSGA